MGVFALMVLAPLIRSLPLHLSSLKKASSYRGVAGGSYYAAIRSARAFRGHYSWRQFGDARGWGVKQWKINKLAVAHGNRTRNRPVSLTPRRRTPIVDSRGFEAVSDAQRSRRYLTLFPGIRPGRGRDTGEKPTPNWRGASRSGDLDPWDCSNHVREGGPFDALLRGPTRAVSAAAR